LVETIEEIDHMTRTLTAALFLAAGLSAPALAQTETPAPAAPDTQAMQCSQEAGAIWDAVQQSQLQDNQKEEVNQVLQQAQAQEQQGDQAGCMRIVDQVKVALGMRTAPDGSVPPETEAPAAPAPAPAPAP